LASHANLAGFCTYAAMLKCSVADLLDAANSDCGAQIGTRTATEDHDDVVAALGNTIVLTSRGWSALVALPALIIQPPASLPPGTVLSSPSALGGVSLPAPHVQASAPPYLQPVNAPEQHSIDIPVRAAPGAGGSEYAEPSPPQHSSITPSIDRGNPFALSESDDPAAGATVTA